MSRHLVVNTQVERPYAATRSSQWQPSPETSAAIQEEDGLASKQQHRTNTLYEEVEEDEEEDDEDDDDDEEEEDEDEEDDLDEDDDSTFTSSPSIPDENINFDLVYALHTFVATVEGQASVVKGDALTLLDDSNSYWWLVSVLKTSEVGYIPAENIETPFERLARLNKHRNTEIASVEHAVHHIPRDDGRPRKAKKKVTMGRGMSFQVQIILTGDDEDQEVGEAYEEWEEDMRDDDDDDDDDNSEDEVDRADNESGVESAANKTASQDLQEKDAASPPPATAATTAPAVASRSANEKQSPLATASQQQPQQQQQQQQQQPPQPQSPSAAGPFWRLFGRNKKESAKPSNSPRASDDATDSGSVSSMASSVMSEDKSNRNSTSSAAAAAAAAATNANANLTVLRVFAGNINVSAMYHSLLVDENTSADHLLMQSLERFHIAQIEDKTAGRSERAATTTTSGGVEYYLTVKAMNGDEITLAPQDKPLAIYQTLTAHLTTPMPSLTHVKQLSTGNGAQAARQRANKSKFGEDSVIRFYLHKRIRRINERDGQVYIKISLYTETKKPSMEAPLMARSAFTTRSLRRKKPASQDTARDRIDKLIAVSSTITIAELTEVALEKFHLVPQNDHYRMTVVTAQQKAEKLLNTSSKVIEVLHDDTHGSRNRGEKFFVLRKMNSHNSRGSPSRDSPRTSKVAPEKHQRPSPGLQRRSPITVPHVDPRTEDIMQRVDKALEKEQNQQRKGLPELKKTTMALMRNVDGGVDILLPHGVLSSKTLSQTQIQYSLLAHTGKERLGLVVQKVLPHPLPPAGATRRIKHLDISELDVVLLANYGVSFMENQERKIARKPLQVVDSSTSQTGAPSLVLSTDFSNDTASNSQPSSLDDLEKEFQRIIAAHAF